MFFPCSSSSAEQNSRRVPLHHPFHVRIPLSDEHTDPPSLPPSLRPSLPPCPRSTAVSPSSASSTAWVSRFLLVQYLLRAHRRRASEALGGPLKYSLVMTLITALEWRRSLVGIVAVLQVHKSSSVQHHQVSRRGGLLMALRTVAQSPAPHQRAYVDYILTQT